MKKIHINNDDNYATPPEFFQVLNDEFHFDFDPCPYNDGEIIQDGRVCNWGKMNFVNPPYSRVLKDEFVRKGVQEKLKGNSSVFLIPVSTSTVLFHEVIQPNADEIRFLKGRIKFGKIVDGNFVSSKQSGTKDSMLVIFKGDSVK